MAKFNLGIGIDSVSGASFPPAKSDLLVWVDQASAATLTNKIAGVGDITVGTNLVPNGDCEGDWGFSKYVNRPAILERSSEQKYSGTYSWKIEPSVIQNPQGILTPYYTTKVGDVINYSFKIRRYAGAAPIRWLVYSGNGLLSRGANYTEANSPDNTWVTASGSYTETKGGSLACIAVFMTTTNAAFYVDDFVVTINGVNTITLPKTTQISDILINKSKYYLGDEPIPVRTDMIVKNENDQVFFDASYKMLIYNEAKDAKVIKSVFDWMAYTPASIFEYFTTERIIKDSEVNHHYGFPNSFFVGNRMYVSYRDAYTHTSFDGVVKFIYTDDLGKTWGSPISVYNGLDILDNYPNILIEDPEALIDVRGLGLFEQTSEYLSFVGFCSAGHMMAADDTDPADPENVDVKVYVGGTAEPFYNVIVKIPLVNGTLDVDNKIVTYIPINSPAASGIIKHNNIYYFCTYNVIGNSNVNLYTSTDLSTWTLKSTIFTDINHSSNEITINFIGEVLWGVSREYANYGCIVYSEDYGSTWHGYTQVIPRLDGLSSIKIGNKLMVAGRKGGAKLITFYMLENGVISSDVIDFAAGETDDCGFGYFTLHDGIYYTTYHNGPLREAPNKYNNCWAGMHFKAIKSSVIDNF